MSEDVEICYNRGHDSLNREKWEENHTSLFWSHPFSFKIALQTILFPSSSSRQSPSNRPLESAAQVKGIPVYPLWRNECSECQNLLWIQVANGRFSVRGMHIFTRPLFTKCHDWYQRMLKNSYMFYDAIPTGWIMWMGLVVFSESKQEAEVTDLGTIDDSQRDLHEREKERWRESFNNGSKT